MKTHQHTTLNTFLSIPHYSPAFQHVSNAFDNKTLNTFLDQ